MNPTPPNAPNSPRTAPKEASAFAPVHVLPGTSSKVTMAKAERTDPNSDNSSAAATTARAWRIAFKVTSLNYDFSAYDEVDINSDDYCFFEPEVFAGNNKFYDLCRKRGRYIRFHEDFAQTYFFELFGNTPFPCNLFIFVEELTIKNGKFIDEPKQLTVDSSNVKKSKKFWHSKSNKHSVQVDPDYEIFYINSPSLTTSQGSFNDLFLSLSSYYLRASPLQRGSNLFKHHAFACYLDGKGMSFIKQRGFLGLVPNLPNASTILPLILLVSRALGYKYCLRKINKLLGHQLSEKFRQSHKLYRKGQRHLKSLSFLYYSVEYFLTQSFLVSSINHKNSLSQELFREIIGHLDIPREYGAIKEQLEPLNQLIAQLTSQEILKGQGSLRFAIVALGFFMVLVVVIVSAILGVEPMLRMLNELGILPENFLKL